MAEEKTVIRIVASLLVAAGDHDGTERFIG